jgi:hypothetical protein
MVSKTQTPARDSAKGGIHGAQPAEDEPHDERTAARRQADGDAADC